MSDLVIYHENCTDGLGAALAARLWLAEKGRLAEAEFVTAQYGDEAIGVKDRDVMILDFSYDRGTLLAMQRIAKSIVVIDHHKSAQAQLADLPFCIFDMDKAGCVLTWEYLFPDKPLPLLFEYLQDRDLWQWKLPQSKEVSAALRSYKPLLEEWEEFLPSKAIDWLKLEGRSILRYQDRHVEMVLSHEPSFVEIGGHSVPCINSTTLISEVAGQLAKGHPFAACYFDTNDGKRVFSLRSDENGLDVSEIARSYGGGGHARAAGFTISRPTIMIEPGISK